MHLTDREQQTLELITQGHSNRNMAALLGVTEHTVKYYISNILRKFDAGTKAEAVWQGVINGFLKVPQ